MAGLPFVEEIDFNEINIEEILGQGTFGTVKKGKWKTLDVAIKIIETEQQKKAFIVEVQQLSRVNHPNIIKLYGACTQAQVCLVMEYADGGSLYDLLYKKKEIEYTLSHAISWLLQTANGMAYLHDMKPRPLIIRDLKPANLLLFNGGTLLKMCDFGTVCDKQSKMTNGKGSAAWMAPEVFEGHHYSEKCDVFSWGIILWEVLARQEPYHEYNGAFCVMWAIHTGKRPPLIAGCPKPLENLMTRAWAQDPSVRPTMMSIRNELSTTFKFMNGADKHLLNMPTKESDSNEDIAPIIITAEHKNETGSSGSKTILGQKFDEMPDASILSTIPDDKLLNVEDAGEKYAKDIRKRRSTDLSSSNVKLPLNLGHRRSGSYDSPHLKQLELSKENSKSIGRSKSPNLPILSTDHMSDNVTNESFNNNISYSGNYVFLLEPKLQPLPPIQCAESIEIYEEHLNLARDLLRYQNEMAYIMQKKNELEGQLKDKDNSFVDEYFQTKKENESLLQLQCNLKRQLEMIRSQQQKRNSDPSNKGNSDWVMI